MVVQDTAETGVWEDLGGRTLVQGGNSTVEVHLLTLF